MLAESPTNGVGGVYNTKHTPGDALGNVNFNYNCKAPSDTNKLKSTTVLQPSLKQTRKRNTPIKPITQWNEWMKNLL